MALYVPHANLMTTQATHNVLLTGATGFVGRELLWRLLRAPENRVVCLIRGHDASESAARLNAILYDAGRGCTQLVPLPRFQPQSLAGQIARQHRRAATFLRCQMPGGARAGRAADVRLPQHLPCLRETPRPDIGN